MIEVNFDGLIGPSHNYAGLAIGNVASQQHAQQISYPKKAALEGLTKMQWMIDAGFVQGFFPPHFCPRIELLHQLGYCGNLSEQLKRANEIPGLLARIYSASAMWAANAATVTPSTDTLDGKLHITAANLYSNDHRKLEAKQTLKALSTVFSSSNYFTVHQPLPDLKIFSDEGAANHSRLYDDDNYVHLFCYAKNEAEQIYPSRQSLAASQSIARFHKIPITHQVFIQQSSDAINAGAFHNDVVAVANANVLFFHEKAYDKSSRKDAFRKIGSLIDFKPIEVTEQQVSLNEAVKTYLFNSQLLNDPTNKNSMRLLLPAECQHNKSVRRYLDTLIQDYSQPIRKFDFIDVRQSMDNGGGPACLRLRVALTVKELSLVDQRYLLDVKKIEQLQQCVNTFYPDSIVPEQLQQADLAEQCLLANQKVHQLIQAF
ncbi:hypothetical protein A3759_02970 [Thalassolituus sp. HI0120]|nr:hypothetical protein A3759_02970 [Thalassolituus sp. HI0120]